VGRGKFITIEGIEGAGKSTAIETLCTYLGERDLKVVNTREPGGTSIGEAIRRLLLSIDNPPMHEDTELLLMFAARAEHVNRVIRPSLMDGKWVVCDRFTDASYAYQGAGRGIVKSRIAALEQWVLTDLRPDLTLLLDVDVKTGISRARHRGKQDRFEQEALNFFEKIRQAYLERARCEPERFHIIDACAAPDRVSTQILVAIESLLRQRAHKAE
jgi:dTMP kinase